VTQQKVSSDEGNLDDWSAPVDYWVRFVNVLCDSKVDFLGEFEEY